MGTRHRELHEGRIDPGLCGRRLAATIGTVPRRRRRSLREEVISALAGFDLLLGLWWSSHRPRGRPVPPREAAHPPEARKYPGTRAARGLAARPGPLRRVRIKRAA